jgi:hypothetical protein
MCPSRPPTTRRRPSVEDATDCHVRTRGEGVNIQGHGEDERWILVVQDTPESELVLMVPSFVTATSLDPSAEDATLLKCEANSGRGVQDMPASVDVASFVPSYAIRIFLPSEDVATAVNSSTMGLSRLTHVHRCGGRAAFALDIHRRLPSAQILAPLAETTIDIH